MGQYESEKVFFVFISLQYKQQPTHKVFAIFNLPLCTLELWCSIVPYVGIIAGQKTDAHLAPHSLAVLTTPLINGQNHR